MQEIKCPKCGEVFQVDESGYAAIVKQVRDSEFEKEIKQRIKDNSEKNAETRKKIHSVFDSMQNISEAIVDSEGNAYIKKVS